MTQAKVLKPQSCQVRSCTARLLAHTKTRKQNATGKLNLKWADKNLSTAWWSQSKKYNVYLASVWMLRGTKHKEFIVWEKIIKDSEKGNKLNTENCVWTFLDVIKVW